MNAKATIAPAHDEEQHLRALARANEVRLARAALKRRIAAGDLCVAQVILDSPWEAESMAVADLVESQRRWGRARCRRVLATVPVSESKPVGSLTERQRHALAGALREAATTARPARTSASRSLALATA